MPNHRASNSSKDKAEAGNDGEWLNKVSAPHEVAPLYAPQGVEMGERWLPLKKKNCLETAGWPEPITDVKHR